ncbi:glycosyltransferase [uncultured Microbacterium sp.]|uniref:glycosyltransferase family 2 protein n=1 Tax=uncultured Microbacterium sp. TaxID=191216 RepID=UPI0028E3134A|nr:glycosyltransferase [uncultured Microbacterium sp.]
MIGIPTYRRPEKLAELLAALPDRVAECDDVLVRVVVADNDSAASARRVVEEADVDATYVIESTPGIAAVRNRILDASAGADVVCFLDDDERPLPRWLPALLDTWRSTGAAAVMGRVISVFDGEPDPWLMASGVFQRRERPTGLALVTLAAGNLLLDLRQVGALGIRFDSSIGLAGGEDTCFGRSLVARGATIVWCNESRAEDYVPRERLTRAWAMRRAFNGGNAATDIDLRLERRPHRRLLVRVRRLLGGGIRAGLGLAQHLWGRLTRDIRLDARGLRTAYRGAGMASAAIGVRRHEYARGTP